MLPLARLPCSPRFRLWLYLCTLLLALLLILGKRRSEIALLGPGAAAHRRNLARYAASSLDRWLLLAAATTVAAYVLYTLFSPATYGSPILIVTVPFVVLRPCAVRARHTHALWRGEPRSAALPRPVAARQRSALGPNCAGAAVCGECSSNVVAERECRFYDVDHEQLTENPKSAARGIPAGVDLVTEGYDAFLAAQSLSRT